MNEAPLESLRVLSGNAFPAARILSELARYNGGLKVNVVERSMLQEQRGFCSDGHETQPSYRIAEDCTLSEFNSLIRDLINRNADRGLRPIFALRFRQEANALRVMITDIQHTYEQSVTNESITGFIRLITHFADTLNNIADTISTQANPADTGETGLVTENLALRRLGTSEQAIHDRARRVIKLLERSDGTHIIDRYTAFISAKINHLLPELLQKTVIAESANAMAQNAYTFLPGRIAAPASYWIANPYAFEYGSPDQEQALRFKDAFTGSQYEKALQYANARSESGIIDLRIKDNLHTLREQFSQDIQTVKEKKTQGSLTAEELRHFMSRIENEINKYGGWYGGSELLMDVRLQHFGQATESSPAAVVFTGQMQCTIRAALFGQLLMEAGLSDLEVFSTCTDIHTAIITKMPDGNYVYTTFQVGDGVPSSLRVPLPARRIGTLFEPLSQTDVMPVRTDELMPKAMTGAAKSTNITTIHRGLTGVTCVAYTILASEYYQQERQTENKALMEIVTTLDPYNPKFAQRKEKARLALLQ